MSEPDINRLKLALTAKAKEARDVLKQSPPILGAVSANEIERMLIFVEAAIDSDRIALRGNIVAARTRLRQCRFPREESLRLFGLLADIAFTLDDLEECAVVALFEPPSSQIGQRRSLLVERASIAKDVERLEEQLLQVERALGELERNKGTTPRFDKQNRFIDFVKTRSLPSKRLIRHITDEPHVDLASLTHSVNTLTDLLERFVGTALAPAARVTDLVRRGTLTLARASKLLSDAEVEVRNSGLRSLGVAQKRPRSFGAKYNYLLDQDEVTTFLARIMHRHQAQAA